MTTTTATAPHLPDIQAPEGVPTTAWQRAVELVRTEALTAASYWGLWCIAYRKHLRGFADGRSFYGLFEEYEQAGGKGSPYGRAPVMADPGPAVAADARSAAGVTAGASGRQDAGNAKPGAGNGGVPYATPLGPSS